MFRHSPHPHWAASGAAAVLLALLLGACATSSRPAAARASTDNANNVVISSGGGGGGGQLIFKGRDNLVESRSRNSQHVPANDQQVLIIEGNQNHLSYSEDGVVEPKDKSREAPGPGRRDTAVIRANGLRRDVRVTGPNAAKKAALLGATAPKAAPTEPTRPANVVEWKGETVDIARDAVEAAGNYDEREVMVPALKGFVPVPEALQYYAKRLQQGEVDALYQVALIFRSSSQLAEQKKAVDYLEAAARKSHGAAALALGELYELGLRGWGGTALEPSRTKAKYYYLLALRNGATLSDAKVAEINGW